MCPGVRPDRATCRTEPGRVAPVGLRAAAWDPRSEPVRGMHRLNADTARRTNRSEVGLDARRLAMNDSGMLRLAAFADEISPDLDEQIRVCRDNEVTHFELRGVNHKNVLDFDDAIFGPTIRPRLADNGMGVVSIASPVGKAKITEPWEPHFDRFKIAVELAEYFEAPFIRVFSYYPPEGGDAHSNTATRCCGGSGRRWSTSRAEASRWSTKTRRGFSARRGPSART